MATNQRPRIDWDNQPYARMSNTDLARVLGVSDVAVYLQRKKRGIAPFDPDGQAPGSPPLEHLSDDLFERGSNTEIAARYTVPLKAVQQERVRRAIPINFKLLVTDDMFRQRTDREISGTLGCSRVTICRERKRRGLPLKNKNPRQFWKEAEEMDPGAPDLQPGNDPV